MSELGYLLDENVVKVMLMEFFEILRHLSTIHDFLNRFFLQRTKDISIYNHKHIICLKLAKPNSSKYALDCLFTQLVAVVYDTL